jgi:hypothetical protein
VEEEGFQLLSTSTQWVEHRGFERLYGRNPAAQARYVKTLLGQKATFTELRMPSAEEQQVVEAIDVVVGFFARKYPEFLEDECQADSDTGSDTYRADPLLLEQVKEILGRE